MAGFKTHITVSSLLGVGYGTVGCMLYDVPLPTAVLSAGLCGVAGMLPDLDSDSGVPLRESIAFGAAVIPMMLADRLHRLNLPHEYIVLAGGLMYLLVRFMLAGMLKRYTVHRGMFHSIPAALIFGELAFLIACRESLNLRWFQAGAVTLGYLTHLVLDEIWSLGFFRVKSSFGTALKLYGESGWANVSAYAKLVVLTYFMLQDPNVLQSLHKRTAADPQLQAAQRQPAAATDPRTAQQQYPQYQAPQPVPQPSQQPSQTATKPDAWWGRQ